MRTTYIILIMYIFAKQRSTELNLNLLISERMLDRLINATWKPGFAVIRPLINDLVSTAFTDIWSHSFKDFPIDNFIRD